MATLIETGSAETYVFSWRDLDGSISGIITAVGVEVTRELTVLEYLQAGGIVWAATPYQFPATALDAPDNLEWQLVLTILSDDGFNVNITAYPTEPDDDLPEISDDFYLQAPIDESSTVFDYMGFAFNGVV